LGIIFYEHEHCEKILAEGVDRITQRDLNYLAKYWDHHGETPSQIRKNLIQFCMDNDKYFNEIQSRQKLRRALSQAKNYNLRFPNPVEITKSELNSIESLDNYKYEKFLFVMLVVAKFFKEHRSKKVVQENAYDSYLYSNASMKDIKDIAGIAMTYKEWDTLKHELTVAALISPTRMGGKCWNIGFNSPDDEVIITVSDYRNPVSYYQEYKSEEMMDCAICGVKTVRKSNRHKYCNLCWKSYRREQNRINVKKMRENMFEKASD
jgi:hypothetical protein